MRTERARSAATVAALTAAVLLCACSDDDAAGPQVDAGREPVDARVAADASARDAALTAGDAGSDATSSMDSGAGSDAALGDAASSVDAALEDAALDSELPAVEDLPYARSVTSFTPGTNAGYGQNKYPGVVLGPPSGKGTGAGSLDVLSLGVGGSIVLEFGALDLVDGAGPDFIVFENPFWPSGDATMVFADLGQVSVSEDGSTWHTFPCDADGDGNGVYAGCAGWTPTLQYDAFSVVPLDPSLTGGDAFDLSAVGVSRARYVRIVDQATSGGSNTGGFDLDAVGVIHTDARP